MEKEFIEFVNYLADEAKKISQKYFRNSIIINSKENSTPVTIADMEIESRLRELIAINYPTHAIIGEEFENKSSLNSEYCWVLDPIDGTVAFSTGKPTFTNLIALIKNDKPILSVISQPISNERFIAYDFTASLNNTPIKTSDTRLLKDVRLNATTPYMFVTEHEKNTFDTVRKSVKLTSFSGDAYAYGLLAAGYIDVIMEADLQYYDVAALIPLIEGSGGVITDWQGMPLTRSFNGQCLASANEELHEQILKLINS
ncbi:MAG: histidinol phosphate phosphatase [Burkholderiales bacterium]|nr:histidinol phosphate phosphatase [Burkholderiales bacterium]